MRYYGPEILAVFIAIALLLLIVRGRGSWRRHWAYLKYVVRHKWFVFQAGYKLGVPLLTLILHDWDKFLPDEWFPYAACFYTPTGGKQYVETAAFAYAWRKHQQRNKHHWQYWLVLCRPDRFHLKLRTTNIVYYDRGTPEVVLKMGDGSWTQYPASDNYTYVPEEMPTPALREMLADWKGAGQAVGKPNTLQWYSANRDQILLGQQSRYWIERQLGYTHPAA